MELENRPNSTPRDDSDSDIIEVDGDKLITQTRCYGSKYIYYGFLFLLFVILLVTGLSVSTVLITGPNLLTKCYNVELFALSILSFIIILWVLTYGVLILIKLAKKKKFDSFKKKTKATKCKKCCFCGFVCLQILFALMVLVSFILVVALSVGLSYFFISHNITLDGTIEIPKGDGLEKTAHIRRDADGVVHIIAETINDGYFAQGYATAQARLWQLQLQRLLARGEISSIPLFGEKTRKVDMEFKILGFYESAKKSIPHLPAPTLALLKSYVAGINAYLKTGPPLSVEFGVFGQGVPKDFAPEDMIAWGKFLAYSLSKNHRDEIQRYKLLQLGIPLKRVEELYPNYPDQLNPTVLSASQLGLTGVTEAEKVALEAQFTNNSGAYMPKRIFSKKQEFSKEYLKTAVGKNWLISKDGFASNNWVVSGKKTKTGKPILCNDPHLTLLAPSLWMLVHLNITGTGALIGSSLVGVPGVLIGRNDHVSWGITNAGTDDQDLYVMRDTPDGNSYYYKNTTEKYEIRNYDLNIAGKSEKINVKWSRYGPVINEIFNLTGPNVCLKWITLGDKDDSIIGVTGLYGVKNWQGFLDNWQNFSAPSFSFVYADKSGNIGYTIAGKVPIRKPGHSGQFPVVGDGSFDHEGWINYQDLPRVLNPSEGWLASANNRLTPRGYKFNLGLTWSSGYRSARLHEIFQNTTDGSLDIESMKNILRDVESQIWQTSFKRVFKKMTNLEGQYKTWLDRLLKWDSKMTMDSQEATVFEMWWYRIWRSLRKDELSGYLKKKNPVFWLNVFERELFPRVNNTSPPSVNTTNAGVSSKTNEKMSFAKVLGIKEPTKEFGSTDSVCTVDGSKDCLEFATKTFKKSIDVLIKKHGAIPEWGTVHISRFSHQGLGTTPLGCLANREIPNRGGTDTVAVSNSKLENGKFVSKNGQSYKQIINWGDLTKSLFIHGPGTDGNMLSAQYDNLITKWRDGEYLSMSTQNIVSNHDLNLVPTK